MENAVKVQMPDFTKKLVHSIFFLQYLSHNVSVDFSGHQKKKSVGGEILAIRHCFSVSVTKCVGGCRFPVLPLQFCRFSVACTGHSERT